MRMPVSALALVEPAAAGRTCLRCALCPSGKPKAHSLPKALRSGLARCSLRRSRAAAAGTHASEIAMPRTLLVKNADVLVTMDDDRREIRGGGVLVEGNRIVAVGPSAELPGTADEVIDAGGHVVLPGLVNTHHPKYQSLTRAVPGAQDAELFGFSNRVPSVNPSLRSPHPSLARHHPTDPVSGPAIVLSRFEGACAGPMVLSAVGTRPPHDGSSSESAFQCGSRGPRAAATKPTEWPHPRPGRDPSTRPKDGREPMSGSSRAGPPIPRPDDVRPSCSAPGRRPLPSSASRA